MGILRLSFDNGKAANYLLLFQQGRQEGLNYVYSKSFHHLIYFGNELLNDEFTVSSLLHECYLKAWNERKRMESLPHIYRFIRMNLRWQILRHIEKSRHSIYGQTLCLDQFENTIGESDDLLQHNESLEEDAQKLETLTQTIQYLPPEARQIILLHFQKGLTHKQIAERLGKTTSQISSQVDKSIKQLRSMIHLSSKKKELNHVVSDTAPHIQHLDCEQSKIYELRKNQKLPFNDIAKKLGINLIQVQKQYIKAHQLMQKPPVQNPISRF